MSSFSTNTNSESAHFQIGGSDLTQFYKTNHGQHFASKSLSINNIHFQVYIFPNGHNKNKEDLGYVQFIVVTNKFESAIKCVTVRCRLYCPQLQIMFKDVKVLTKNSDSIKWLPYQLQLSEYQNIIIKNGSYIHYLDFVCDIEILKIKYKSNGIGRKLSLHSTRKQSSSSMDMNIFQPQTMFPVKSQADIEWLITNKNINSFRNTANRNVYYSNDINNMWCLCLFPNGSKPKKNRHVELELKLIRLPPEIKSIEIDLEIQIQRKNILKHSKNSNNLNPSTQRLLRRNILFSYNKSKQITNLFETRKLNLGEFKLRIIIKIKRVFEDIGNSANGRVIKESWNVFGFDQFQPGLFQCNIDYGQNISTNNNYKNVPKYSYSSTGSVGDFAENICMDEQKQMHSMSKTNKRPRPYRKKSLQKEPQRKISYSSLTPPTTSTRVMSNSITSFHRSSVDQSAQACHMLNNITEDKEDSIKQDVQQDNKIAIETWNNDESDVKKTNDDLLNDVKQENENNDAVQLDVTIFNNKFERWLCDEVQKKEYLQNFISRGCADIRLIKTFDNKTLIDIGINNEYHRKVILDEVNLFKKELADFDVLMNKHDVLRSFRKSFKKNGILTTDDLKSITTKQELQKILNLEINDSRFIEIWNITQPSQSQNASQLQINEFREQLKSFTAAMDTLDVLIPQMTKMYNQINEQKPNASIQQQADAIFNGISRRLMDQRAIRDQILQRNDDVIPYISQSDQMSYFGSLPSPSIIRKGNININIQQRLLAAPEAIVADLSTDTNISNNSNDSTTQPTTSVEFACSHLNSDKVLGEQMLQSIEEVNSNKNQIVVAPLAKVKKNIFVLNDNNSEIVSNNNHK